jgi:hypothetical protein
LTEKKLDSVTNATVCVISLSGESFMGWVQGQARTAGRRRGECKTAGNPAKQTASGGNDCMAQYHEKLHFLKPLIVLCYTLFAPISAVFAESGDSVVRAGFLVLFIREKYRKKRIMINLLISFCLDTKGTKNQGAQYPLPALPSC